MSTSPDSPRPWPGYDEEASDDGSVAEAFADVFNRFAFDSRRSRWRKRSARKKQEREEPETAGTADPVFPTPSPTDENVPTEPEDEQPCQFAEEEKPATHIRPYAWTGGRTRSNYKLELETLVSTSEACPTAQLQRIEHHSIAELCQHPRSVAEVGAVLCVPLGVARVLIGDMADLGLITVHETVADNGSASHLILMERVLSGLRRL